MIYWFEKHIFMLAIIAVLTPVWFIILLFTAMKLMIPSLLFMILFFVYDVFIIIVSIKKYRNDRTEHTALCFSLSVIGLFLYICEIVFCIYSVNIL